jgi:hypothetical protein
LDGQEPNINFVIHHTVDYSQILDQDQIAPSKSGAELSNLLITDAPHVFPSKFNQPTIDYASFFLTRVA